MSDKTRSVGCAGRVYYDEDCSVCRRWIDRVGPMLRRYGFEIGALQEPGLEDRLGMPRERLLDELLVRAPGGTVYGGADALAYVASRIPWAWPVVLLWRIPIVKTLARSAYRGVANRRPCRLPSRPSDETARVACVRRMP